MQKNTLIIKNKRSRKQQKITVLQKLSRFPDLKIIFQIQKHPR